MAQQFIAGFNTAARNSAMPGSRFGLEPGPLWPIGGRQIRIKKAERVQCTFGRK